jgi:hypothetical protein
MTVVRDKLWSIQSFPFIYSGLYLASSISLLVRFALRVRP